MRQIGVPFEQRPVDLDETALASEVPAAYVQRLALEKAGAALAQLPNAERTLVLGSDTSVVLGDRIFGKPANEADCTEMLEALAGREHQVLTAVALVGAGSIPAVRLVVTRVHFRSIERSEMSAYWHTGEPCDKAGGYAIQGKGALFIRHIEGSYSAVMGLPVYETADLLTRAGFDL